MPAPRHKKQAKSAATAATKPSALCPPTDRELYAKTFDDLAREAEDSVALAAREVQRFKKTLESCKSVGTLRSAVDAWTLATLARGGLTADQIMTQQEEAVRRFAQNRELDCFIDHIPEATRHVIRAIRRKLLRAPRNVWRQLSATTEPIPKEDDELRNFWRTQILPGLAADYASEFSHQVNSDRIEACDHVVACKLLGQLVRIGEDKETEPFPTPKSTQFSQRESESNRSGRIPAPMPTLRANVDAREVWYGKTKLKINTGADFDTLNSLLLADGAIVSHVDLLRAVNPSEHNTPMTTAAPQVKDAVQHIKNALKMARAPYKVQNVRKRGYKLVSNPDHN